MKTASKLLLIVALASVSPLAAQDAPPTESLGTKLSLNVFRAPSTGLDYRTSRRTSVHAGFYPTVLSIDGQREGVNFVRVGGTFWLTPAASGFYVTTGVALSLDRESWGHSFANEAGYHLQLGSRWGARLGGIVLTTFGGRRSSLNPTVGLSFRPGARRIP